MNIVLIANPPAAEKWERKLQERGAKVAVVRPGRFRGELPSGTDVVLMMNAHGTGDKVAAECARTGTDLITIPNSWSAAIPKIQKLLESLQAERMIDDRKGALRSPVADLVAAKKRAEAAAEAERARMAQVRAEAAAAEERRREIEEAERRRAAAVEEAKAAEEQRQRAAQEAAARRAAEAAEAERKRAEEQRRKAAQEAEAKKAAEAARLAEAKRQKEQPPAVAPETGGKPSPVRDGMRAWFATNRDRLLTTVAQAWHEYVAEHPTPGSIGNRTDFTAVRHAMRAEAGLPPDRATWYGISRLATARARIAMAERLLTENPNMSREELRTRISAEHGIGLSYRAVGRVRARVVARLDREAAKASPKAPAALAPVARATANGTMLADVTALADLAGRMMREHGVATITLSQDRATGKITVAWTTLPQGGEIEVAP